MTSLSFSSCSAVADPIADSIAAAFCPDLQLWQGAEMQAQMWQHIVQNANDPVIVTTTDLSCSGPQILYVNAAFSRLTGYAPGEVIGLTPRILQGPLTNRDEMERMRADLEAGRSFVGQSINYTKSGQPYWMEWSVYDLRDENGTLTNYVAVQRDISARKNYEAQIEAQSQLLLQANEQLARVNERLATLSLTDSLTDIANHRAFHQKLNEEIARGALYQTPLSLLMLDVDCFKAYNDDFGHPAGDVALQIIARVLQQHLRESDLVARHGGEEFAVLLPQTDRAGVGALAEILRSAIERANWPLRTVTVSIGGATLDNLLPQASRGGSICPKIANNLIDQADRALYSSKKRGRNCVTCCE